MELGEQLAQGFFEHAPDAIVVVDKNGHLVRSNALAQKMFGYSGEELLGQPIEILVPDRFRGMHVEHRDGYIRNPRTRPMGAGLALSGRRRDGTEFSVDIMLSPVEVGTERMVMAIVRDVTERKQAEERLQEANQFLDALFESAPDAIIVVDEFGALQRINVMAEKLFGYSRDELVGEKLEILIPERFRHKHVEQRDAYIGQPRTRTMGAGLDLYGRRKDGSEFPVDIMLSPLRLSGESRRIMAVIRDITDRKGIEEDLRRARDEAIEANRLKSQFVANISHEVRTPMAGIIGMSEVLLYEGSLTEEQREAVEHIYGSSQRLLSVLNDLLDFSKLEAGAVQLDIVKFSLKALMEEVMTSISAAATKKSLVLESTIAPELPDMVMGDESKIRQTLMNLAHNAVKFTVQGSVRVSLERETANGSPVNVRFSVQDTGLGISTEVQSRLFQPFVQADGTHRRRFGGTGLGLSIAKRFVELMGGRIGMFSTPEQGSTFWFTVPVEPSD